MIRHEQSQRAARFFAVAAIAVGLLLWARLILVTGYPRSAIAHPPARSQEARQAAMATQQYQQPDPAPLPPQAPQALPGSTPAAPQAR